MPDCAPLFELEEIDLLTADATAALAIDLAPRLAPGDVLLLEGAVGAGKTHFSRALIQSIQLVPEDVPSPTFTLVQTYDTIHGPLWHADLYRIASVHEIEELGLAEAFETAICLIEWPDRLESLTPSTALHLRFSDGAGDTARRLSVSTALFDWTERLKGWNR